MSTETTDRIVLDIGQLLVTPNALSQVAAKEAMTALARHMRGDWGDVDEEDRQSNDEALREGLRILSAYHTAGGTKFWIITEADRSYTTILLPEDY